MSTPSGVPIVPIPHGAGVDGTEEPLADTGIVDDGDHRVDPDLDADQVDSADADRRAATEGVKDGDAEV